MSALRMLTILAVGLAAALAGASAHADEPAAAEPAINVSRTARGLTLEARDASLREVLERLAAVEKLDLEIRGTSDPRVTATIRDASLAEALQRLVRYDFVLGVGRLIVYLGDARQPSRTTDTLDRAGQRRGGFRPPVRQPPYHQPQPEPEPEPDSEPEDE